MFQNCSKESINSFELDLAHYFPTAGYSWDALLRFNDTNFKLLSDIEKYQLIESTIGKSLSVICKGYAEVNNKFLKS